MSTIPTQNPVPSEAARDLKFNSGKIDEFVTSNNHFYTDRFGKKHYTIDGINYLSKQAMQNYGYITKKSFESGNTIINPNDVLLWESNGEYYRWDGELPKVVSAGSTPESAGGVSEGKWVSVGDSSLRNQLSSNGGSALIGDVHFDNIANAINTIRPFSGNIFDIFIVYGQSNAVGYAPEAGKKDYPDNLNQQKCLFWDYREKKLKPLIREMPYSSGDVSTGHAWASFANKYTSLTGRGCVIIPCAKGGMPIVQLMKGVNTVYYNSMIESYTSCVEFMMANSLDIGKKSILWHQGETDQKNKNAREWYLKRINILIDDIISDIGIDKFYIHRVGNPQSREEVSWMDIQLAQDDICAIKDVAIMAFKGCGAFTKENGLLSVGDGVHYTQFGYNLMGDQSARVVSDDLFNKTTQSEININEYGSLFLPQDQRWVKVSGTARYDNGWKLMGLDNDFGANEIRLSGIRDIKIDNEKISFQLAYNPTDILEMSVEINHLGKVFKIDPSVYFRRVTSGNGYTTSWIDVRLLQDLDFFCDANGVITRYPDNSSPSEFISSQVSAVKESNYVVIKHPNRQYGFPSIQPYGRDSASEFTRVSIGKISNKSSAFSFHSGDSYTLAMVSLPSCEVNPLLTSIQTLQINVSAVIAERRR